MESSRPKEKRKTEEHSTPGNGNRHEINEQELDGARKEGSGQNDLALLSHTQQQMQEKMISVATASAAVRLNIHQGKNKIIRYNTTCTNQITHDREALEDEKTFTYLGSIIYEHDGSDTDVKVRAAYLQVKNIWNSKQLSVNQQQSQNFQ
ncbi:unnamed protein product [Schistosoma curassoni]|uniref:Cystatin domain-containing protein n=1 Tax=Schistosoma curassoni TaxID=6186 RepID=A0A183KMC9_9TREM|nr:unnamed protein product [Schistosoma curassoni]